MQYSLQMHAEDADPIVQSWLQTFEPDIFLVVSREEDQTLPASENSTTAPIQTLDILLYSSTCIAKSAANSTDASPPQKTQKGTPSRTQVAGEEQDHLRTTPSPYCHPPVSHRLGGRHPGPKTAIMPGASRQFQAQRPASPQHANLLVSK
jgi:hypothetical protein